MAMNMAAWNAPLSQECKTNTQVVADILRDNGYDANGHPLAEPPEFLEDIFPLDRLYWH